MGDRLRQNMHPVHFLEGRDDFPRCHALGVQEDYFVVHRRKSALVLFNEFGLKAPSSVAWCIELELADFGSDGFSGIPVAVVVSFGLLVPLKAKMIVKFSVQCCLDSNLGEHLLEVSEVIFRLDIFGSRLSDRL